MADLIASTFATHQPNWADIQALLNNILLMADERWLVINKVKEEAHCLHQENFNGTSKPAREILLIKPNWESNSLPRTLQKRHIGRT